MTPKTMTTLDGKHAIVTGGGTGVGAEIARTLADAGAQVTITGRRVPPLLALAATHERIHHAVCDAADGDAMQRMIETATKTFGPPQLLIANAGSASSKPFARMSSQDLQGMLDANLHGVFHLWRHALPAVKGTGWGRMIAIASTAGLKGYPYVSAYVAAKHAVVGLTRALGQELAESGITVNAICPGFTQTPMLERSIADIMAATGRTHEQAAAALVAGNPQRRFVKPAEIASAALWLCSDTAAAVNGQAIALSGGET